MSYNTLLHAYAIRGHTPVALSLLSDMETLPEYETNCRPDAVSYSICMNSLLVEGETTDEAV
eukprot:14445524-Ditylum_brightwellii.AAC.1